MFEALTTHILDWPSGMVPNPVAELLPLLDAIEQLAADGTRPDGVAWKKVVDLTTGIRNAPHHQVINSKADLAQLIAAYDSLSAKKAPTPEPAPEPAPEA